MRHIRLACSLLAGALAVIACEQVGDRTPPGYMDACYGGREDLARNWVLSDRRMTITVTGQEKDWPALGSIIKDVGTAQGLKVFDVSNSIPDYVRTLAVSACDESGLYVHIDKRIYERTAANFDGDRIVTVIATYRKDANWEPVAQALVAAFESRWPGKTDVERLPLIPIDQRALPDSVREELEHEGVLERRD